MSFVEYIDNLIFNVKIKVSFIYFVKVEICPERKKLPKKQYCVLRHFKIHFSVYSVLLAEAASVSVEKLKYI